MYSPRLSKAATTFRSESSSTGSTTCLQSDKVSKTGADFMGHTRTLSLKQTDNCLLMQSIIADLHWSVWHKSTMWLHRPLSMTAQHTPYTAGARKLLTCLWGGTAVSGWGRGSGTSGHSLQWEHPTARQCCLWKRSQACGHLDSS